MDFNSINWLAVVVCVVVAMVVGFFWFGPKTFFPMWWKAIGKPENSDPGAGMSMALMWPLVIIAAFVEAVFMSLMVHAMGSMMPGGANSWFWRGGRILSLAWVCRDDKSHQ